MENKKNKIINFFKNIKCNNNRVKIHQYGNYYLRDIGGSLCLSNNNIKYNYYLDYIEDNLKLTIIENYFKDKSDESEYINIYNNSILPFLKKIIEEKDNIRGEDV